MLNALLPQAYLLKHKQKADKRGGSPGRCGYRLECEVCEVAGLGPEIELGQSVGTIRVERQTSGNVEELCFGESNQRASEQSTVNKHGIRTPLLG